MNKRELSGGRIGWLDLLRGFGIILVVIGHAQMNNEALRAWIYSFHMPLFFFAGGWLYRQKEVLADLKQRVFTLLLPYLSFGVVTLLYWQLFERRFRPSELEFSDAILGLFTARHDLLEFNVFLWFLPCFFVVTVGYNALHRLGGKKLAVGVTALLAVVYALLDLPELPLCLERVCKFSVFYAVGHLLSGVEADEKLRKIPAAARAGLAVVLMAAGFWVSSMGLTQGILWWYAMAVVGLAGAILLCLTLPAWRVITYLGRISLVILCVHGPVYRIPFQGLSMVLNLSTAYLREHPVSLLLVTAITLAVCAVAYEVLVRVLPWMVGKRKKQKEPAQVA